MKKIKLQVQTILKKRFNRTAPEQLARVTERAANADHQPASTPQTDQTASNFEVSQGDTRRESQPSSRIILPPVEPKHRRWLISDCGLTRRAVIERGYSSIPASKWGRRLLLLLGFTAEQIGDGGGLLFPLRSLFGATFGYAFRPDQPWTYDGQPFEFSHRHSGRTDLDVPFASRHKFFPGTDSPELTIWTFNAIDADSAQQFGCRVVNLNGLVFTKDDLRSHRICGSFHLSDFEGPALFVIDADLPGSDADYATISHLIEFLDGRGHDVQFIHLSSAEGSDVPSLAGYIANGGTLEELQTVALPAPHYFL